MLRAVLRGSLDAIDHQRFYRCSVGVSQAIVTYCKRVRADRLDNDIGGGYDEGSPKL